MPIHTDRTIAANRPNIVLKNKDKTCLLIDITIPLETNSSVKKNHGNAYQILEIEVERTWGLKTTTVPVVMGALGTTVTLTKYWKSKLSEHGGSKQQPSQWLWEPLAPR